MIKRAKVSPVTPVTPVEVVESDAKRNFRHMMDAYQKQNPVKYAKKLDFFNAKLSSL